MHALRQAFLITAIALTAPAAAQAAAVARHPVHHVVKRVTPIAPGVSVPIDEARLITFTQPVATLFVGNPSIADVTIIDSRHAYVLGKTLGETNMIGLDADHRQVLNEHLAVTSTMVGAVTVIRGADTYNYTCTRIHCETNPRPGDPSQWATNTTGVAQQHVETGEKEANVAMGSGQ